MTSPVPASPKTPLPVGTVTFLFTDIVGSTALWELQREAMRISLARHDALLRRCIEEHGGYVVKTTGDGFHAAFASATEAIEAAIAAQKALHAEPWSEAIAIRVRMSFHTGAAELRDGDYYGPTVNRAARLAALGHGGQTLLSEITHNLCRDLAPPEVTFKLLGEHHLKGLTRREAVYEVCHPGLPQAFPPLQTLLAPIDENTPSIAVLPFSDLSPDKDQEYFADGLAEELLNVLSKIHGVRVASRTSAFSFKGTKLDLPAVAQKLNVATILEGSVRKAGRRVRVGAHLIQTTTDSHLWSQSYDRELDDIFAVQDEIAQAVVKELRTTLLGAKQDASSTAQVKALVQAAGVGRGKDTGAYELYLQGRFYADRFTRDDATKGIEYYRQAVALDPLSVPAQRLLGQRCLYAGLLADAETALRKTFELNPRGGFTHYWLGMNHLANGRRDQALSAFKQEVNEGFSLLGLAVGEHALGHQHEAESALRELIAKHADGAAFQIAGAYAYVGDADRAFEWLGRADAERDPGLVEVKAEILLRNLYADPRWRTFLEKM